MPDIVTIISTVGFPIAACIFMGYFIKYQMDSFREQIDRITSEHKQEMSEVTEALNNNTLVITRLCDKLGEFDNESK